MKLFKYDAYKIVISEEALLLKPFKQIWVRDKTKDKSKALQELAYIYFMCDPRSDYQYIIDPKERAKAVIEGEGLKDWKPDKQIKEAMQFYESFKSPSALLLEDTRVAVDKVRTFLRDVDLNALDDKGKPVYTINSITSTIKMIPQLVKDLADAEKAITTEMISSGKMRGSGEKKLFEDGINI